ncbi:MAG TPA: amidohydrolase [Fimbriimonadaceae bacterium]|nr:amidohydrolase [Fimbriimonadaceae bacterium]
MTLYENFLWWVDGSPQAMTVDQGRVVWRGPATDAPLEVGRRIDLEGGTLYPAFIDAHCHILPTGLDLQKLHLGPCSTPGDVLDAVRARHEALEPGAWLHAVHYDQTKFPDGAHLHRDALDAISAERPILLRHVNGHASVANSAALAAARIDETVEDPPGGTFVRDESGRLTGVLLERAHEFVTAAAPEPTLDEMVEAILAAGREMAAVGIGTATDMMTGRWNLARELEAYRLASEQGCPIRLRLFLQWGTVLGPRGIEPSELAGHMGAMDAERCKVVGLKIFADGAIGSATAAIYGRFLNDPDDGRAESGQLIYSPDRFHAMVRAADEAGWRLAVHSIGDRSTDLVLDSFATTADPRRHRIEHAMLLSDAQIERMAAIGCHCTMQPEFLMKFGHAYRRQLGQERTARLKRAESMRRAGIPLSFSSDRPIVSGDPLDGIRTACSRPDGFDPAENVSYDFAVRAYSEIGAIANDDAGFVGRLEAGEVADYRLEGSSG